MPELKYSQDLEFNVVTRRRVICMDKRFSSPNEYSLEFVRAGRMLMFTPKKCLDLKAPMLFWMAPGELYRFECIPGASVQCEHVYADFRGPRAERISAALHEACPQGCLTPDSPEKVDGIFQEMVRKYRIDAVRFHAELIQKIETLMLIISDTLGKEQYPRKDPFGIIRMAEKINADPFASFDFEETAAKTGISYSYFRRLFKEGNGVPIHEYVREQRMKLAAEMLRNTRMRIKEIVYNCRFDNLAEFSREFKRWYGMSPRQYRGNSSVSDD